MIAGNKSDLDSDRQVPQEKAKNFAKEKLGDEKLHAETSGKLYLNRIVRYLTI